MVHYSLPPYKYMYFSFVWGICSRTGFAVWIPLVHFLSCRVFLSPSFMTNTFARYISLDWFFFLSQLEVNHPSPPCLQTFGWEICHHSHIPFFYGTWLFLACIFQHTLFVLYLVFAVSNLWQFECIWSQLKHKPVVTLGRDFLDRIIWSRRSYLKCGLLCLVAAQIKGHERRKLCFTCSSSLSGEISCILLLIHSFLVIITNFIRIPVQTEDQLLSRNLCGGLQCRNENAKTFIPVNYYYKPLLD